MSHEPPRADPASSGSSQEGKVLRLERRIAAKTREEPAKEDARSQRRKKRALVVDDDPEYCFFLAEYLVEAGLEVEVAYNGLDAIETYTNAPNNFDLVILDHHLPERLTGADLAFFLRTCFPDGSAARKIVLITGDGELSFPGTLFSDLMLDHPVYKPIPNETLKHIVATATGQ